MDERADANVLIQTNAPAAAWRVEGIQPTPETPIAAPGPQSGAVRPWGSYTSVHWGKRSQVKHIVVHPGGKLSLQLHHHRSEHWVIIEGTAKVTRGTDELMLSEMQSIFIPVGTVHRLENPGKIPLHLIEIQCGSYLEEDDIVRLDDAYGRCT
jgi:mannose-1-phosphate guanylyltransferase / mannose-6-phosphate isomerase